jgi:deoxycytidylate deaminase
MRGVCDDIFQRAEDMAKKGTMVFKHGAVIAKNGVIIGEGYNHMSSYTRDNYSVHAEIAALMSVPKRKRNKSYLEGATMVVIRISGQDNKWCSSAPCDNCRKEIEKLNIKRIVHS